MVIDWTQLYEKYPGKWVALAKDHVTVLGVGTTAKEALAESQKKGYMMPGLTYIPEEVMSFAGGF